MSINIHLTIIDEDNTENYFILFAAVTESKKVVIEPDVHIDTLIIQSIEKFLSSVLSDNKNINPQHIKVVLEPKKLPDVFLYHRNYFQFRFFKTENEAIAYSLGLQDATS